VLIHVAITAPFGREVETLVEQVNDLGLWLDIALVLQLAEVVAVEDKQDRLATLAPKVGMT
jgi:hypothetical protein